MTASPEPRGRIITFYSYKGGTGRSMAVANVAWILASNGRKVLVIDWDLEAPGLHRYFHPFLEDKELASSPGVIDFMIDLSKAARLAHERTDAEGDAPWYESRVSLLRYARSLDWEFPGDGTIDFIPAGQQDQSYAERVTFYDWQSFYEKLGGGIIFESVKKNLREEYDYVLIDSRTGISDTSGICTVQLPDDLVVMFTLNRQSIMGAAAVANSALEQRRKPSGEPGLRIWPVPTRVEMAEKERLDAARQLCQNTFQRFLFHLGKKDRQTYWGGIEIFYQPYFAYEEVLATFAERKRQTASILMSMEAIAKRITDGDVTELAEINETERLRGLALFTKAAPPSALGNEPIVFIAGSADAPHLAEIRAAIDRAGARLLRADDRPGVSIEVLTQQGVGRADVVVVLLDANTIALGQIRALTAEIEVAVQRGIPIVPVLSGGLGYEAVAKLPPELQVLAKRNVIVIDADAPQDGLEVLGGTLARAVASSRLATTPADSDDPQKGRWGGASAVPGRELRAQVRLLDASWFEVRLEVVATSDKPLDGVVTFHLHPTFQPPVRPVPVEKGRAILVLGAWGAFTAGASADGGKTRLELDLATLHEVPTLFRER